MAHPGGEWRSTTSQVPEQEVDGLLRADRTPELPFEVVATATRGSGTPFDDPFADPGSPEVRR